MRAKSRSRRRSSWWPTSPPPRSGCPPCRSRSRAAPSLAWAPALPSRGLAPPSVRRVRSCWPAPSVATHSGGYSAHAPARSTACSAMAPSSPCCACGSFPSCRSTRSTSAPGWPAFASPTTWRPPPSAFSRAPACTPILPIPCSPVPTARGRPRSSAWRSPVHCCSRCRTCRRWPSVRDGSAWCCSHLAWERSRARCLPRAQPSRHPQPR